MRPIINRLGFCISFILFLLAQSFAFSGKVDSLKNILENKKEDIEKVDLLIELANTLKRQNASQAKIYADEAREMSEKLKYSKGLSKSHFELASIHYLLSEHDQARNSVAKCISLSIQNDQKQLEADAYFLLGRILYRSGEIDSARYHYEQCLELSEGLEYREGLALASKGMGDLFERSGDYEEAMQLYEKCLALSLESNYIDGQLMALNAIGIINEYTGKTDKALEKYLETLRLAESVGDINVAAGASGNVGSLYFIQKNYDKALEYGQIAMQHYQKAENRYGIAFVHQDMGQILKAQGNLQDALQNYKQAEKMRIELNDKRGLSFTYFGLGYTYKHLGDLKKAREYLEKSLVLREELGFQTGISSSIRALGKLHMEAGNYKAAFPYFKKSMDWVLEANDAEGIYETSEALKQYYELLGDYKNAYRYLKMHLAARDSLFNKDQNKQFAEMQTLYETEKKEKQILAQERDILELEKRTSKITNQRNYIMAGSLTLGILGLFGFQFNKVRKERNSKREFAEALIYAQEEERKRVARDLHDGVGQSLLLIQKQLETSKVISIENQNLITNTLQEVRSISQDLHPFQLEKFGFTVAVENMLDKVGRTAGLFITKDLMNIDDRLDPKTQINIFRTIQEALNNIVKHSNASAAKLTINSNDKESIIKIQDNGIGFDHELAILTSKSLGLRTMQERVAAVGGKFRIESVKSEGSTIHITLPLKS